MKHYGDITKINGALVEPVNVIIGGSPCQDLSVAGKQAGLAGERFERQGVPGYIKPCRKEGQAAPGNIETCFNTAGSTGGLIAYKVTASTEPTPQDATEKDGPRA